MFTFAQTSFSLWELLQFKQAVFIVACARFISLVGIDNSWNCATLSGLGGSTLLLYRLPVVDGMMIVDQRELEI